MASEDQKIPFYEKVGYSLGDSAANFVFLTMVCFQQGFYTDVMGLAPSQAALAILIPRLWDAFFDPIIGSTADRTKTRWGRFRPWILWTAVPWSIVMVLAYFTPDGWSNTAMLTWAIVTNTLLMSLYSANNMPYAALGGVMTADEGERNKLNAVRFGAVVFAQWIVQTFTLVLRDKFAHHSQAKSDLAHGWTMTMGVYAVICLICFLITFATTKERVQPVSSAKRPLKQDLANLLKNSPWVVMFIVTFLHFTVISFQGGAGYQYFTRYPDAHATYDVFNHLGMTDPSVGTIDAVTGTKIEGHGFLSTVGYLIPGTRETATHATTSSALYGVVGTVSKIFQLIGIMFAPLLAMRFGKKAVCIVSFALTVIVNFAFYFLGQEQVVGMLALTALSGLVYGPSIPLLWSIFADVVDFGEWKLGIRTTGIVFATIGFALKAGLAFGGAALSWVEEAVGYSDATPNGHEEMFRVSNTLVPAGFFLVCTCVLFALYLNKRTTKQIGDELAQRRAVAAGGAAA